MGKRVGMEVSIAAAEAVKQANVDVISAYPITPQTHIVEHLSEIVANGEMDAEFFCVESEHSALSVWGVRRQGHDLLLVRVLKGWRS